MTSRMITIVGQCAFVNDHKDDTCAVWGTDCDVGVVSAATVGVVAVVGAVAPVPGAVVGAVFTATGDPVVGCVAATGAPADALPAEPVFAVAIVFAIATSVPCMPFNVVCTAASCDGVSVEFDASDVFNWESVAARVLNVWLNSLTWLEESPADAVADVPGAVVATEDEPPVPAIDGGITLGVPASAGGTAPACISRFASVAFATSSCC